MSFLRPPRGATPPSTEIVSSSLPRREDNSVSPPTHSRAGYSRRLGQEQGLLIGLATHTHAAAVLPEFEGHCVPLQKRESLVASVEAMV